MEYRIVRSLCRLKISSFRIYSDMMRIGVYILFLFVLASDSSLLAQCGERNKNHLKNPSFSSHLSEWESRGEDMLVEILDEGTEDENGYLIISHGKTSVRQSVLVPPRARSACVGALVKNSISQPRSGWAILDMQILDVRGKILKGQRMPHLKSGTHWQKLRKSHALPPEAASIRIILKAKDRPEQEMENLVSFDDVFVRFGQ